VLGRTQLSPPLALCTGSRRAGAAGRVLPSPRPGCLPCSTTVRNRSNSDWGIAPAPIWLAA